MYSVTLRPVTTEEYDSLRGPGLEEFTADLARAEHRVVDAALRTRAETFYPETLDAALADEGTHIMGVLSPEGEVVGHLWLGRSPGNAHTGFVYDLVIDPGHRGRGLGRAAMVAAEELLHSEGCTRIALNVFGWNDGAAGLYRSLGFEVDSTQMSKPLAGATGEAL